VCLHDENYHMVTGKPHLDPESMRHLDIKCGKEAKLFEDKS
jgi:hypothetical protein